MNVKGHRERLSRAGQNSAGRIEWLGNICCDEIVVLVWGE